jgi:hypothetical protein
MDQMGSAGYGFAEEYQLLPDEFPCGILSDGEPHNLPCFV